MEVIVAKSVFARRSMSPWESATKSARGAEAHVVSENEQDIWRTFRSSYLLGKSLMESLALRLMNPPKGCSGRGRTSCA